MDTGSSPSHPEAQAEPDAHVAADHWRLCSWWSRSSLSIYLVNEYMVWGSAHQLARDLSSEKQQNLDAAWKEYQKLASRSHFPISLWAARDELRSHLVADADSTIVKFRSPDAPPVSEADWVHARDDLSRAIELDPGDKTLHGKTPAGRRSLGPRARHRGTGSSHTGRRTAGLSGRVARP